MSLIDFPQKDSPLITYQMNVRGRNAAVVAHYHTEGQIHELARATAHFPAASQVIVSCTIAAYSGQDLVRAMLVGEALQGCLARAQRIAVDPGVNAAAEATFDIEQPSPNPLNQTIFPAGAREAPRA